MSWQKSKFKSRIKTPVFSAHHGTIQEFEQFDVDKCGLGIHSGSLLQAEHAIQAKSETDKNAMPRLLSVEVTLENPLRMRDLGTFDADVVWHELREMGLVSDPDDGIEKSIEKMPKCSAFKFVRKKIQDLGYDGIVYLNRGEGISPQDIRSVNKWLEDEDFGFFAANMMVLELSDSEFLKLAPSAQDSYIAFDPSQVEVLPR